MVVQIDAERPKLDVISRRAVSVAEQVFTHRRAVRRLVPVSGPLRVVLAAPRWRARHLRKSNVGSGSTAPRSVREFRNFVGRVVLAHGISRVRGRPLYVDSSSPI
jgi:hypothetical protein